ncbi:hypothetical protein OSB04_012813 [Centaurea solstitialis]|uniref:Ubiquitin-like protease family profile domain-containing protein n=1 Tax=Centaurea solstitialis TaxID=347529 RepID=A0AA38WQ91_9ASTR|nr:hypothetical protein OSB04_012813 [Centaurea solstitialis]
MNDMDLAFFPIVDGVYFYLIVFDLKNPSITIIDNRVWKSANEEAVMNRYKHVSDVLQHIMVTHLISVGHGAAREMSEVTPVRVAMAWQTYHNAYDSGIFLMRHMETYMGDIKSWKTGFDPEGQSQQTQLHDLKKKYATKMIKHKQNFMKGVMLAEVKEFHSLDNKIRAHFLRQANDSRWERIIY